MGIKETLISDASGFVICCSKLLQYCERLLPPSSLMFLPISFNFRNSLPVSDRFFIPLTFRGALRICMYSM